MRAFMTPSIILSVARRSRGFIHIFGRPFDADARFERARHSVTARVMTSTTPGDVPVRTLGLNPDKCTVDEIRHQLRRR